jgi:hypothetical protein
MAEGSEVAGLGDVHAVAAHHTAVCLYTALALQPHVGYACSSWPQQHAAQPRSVATVGGRTIQPVEGLLHCSHPPPRPSAAAAPQP